MNHNYSNHLINETSPYLLQHAHNPVEWYAWGEEALQKAKKEDKPILISIGYASCHWCHVMERESFEDEETAELMNKYFVNIKVDREERPDLDHIYMDAVQAISGRGGWPLNVFLTPEGKPFFGGTYYPPVRAYNMMSWKELLTAINTTYTEKRGEIETQAENIIQHLSASNLFGIGEGENKEETVFTKENLLTVRENLLNSADKEWGGFGNAPKFPQTFSIQNLLADYYFTGEEQSIQHALLSIDKMIQGGIYDHIGGGFSRYSTDKEWFAPHFEKMLYDNALLITTLAEAYQLTAKERYAEVINETIAFVERELLSPENGFYSALDADSEGIEGKFYTWQKQEIEKILGPESELFCKAYNITDKGNWEHGNIVWLTKTFATIAATENISETDLINRLQQGRNKLLAERAKRIRPALDDKILLGWNALMVSALCKAYAATGTKNYLKLAEKNIIFLEDNLQTEEGGWHHTWKNGIAKYTAFLDDYAYLIKAYIMLQEVTGNSDYLIKAKKITELVLFQFSEEESGFFYFTPAFQKDVVVRKKEVYDGATPSGNAVMANNLFYLALVFDVPAWQVRAYKMAEALRKAVVRYPNSFGVWAASVQNLTYGINEIAVVGANASVVLKAINHYYIPNKIIQASPVANNNFPLLKNKIANEPASIYLCRQYVCQQPVHNVDDLLAML